MTKLSPCRCCGETEHLETHPAYQSDWAFTQDGQIKRTETGAFAIEDQDYVECSICGTEAPAYIWNLSLADWPARRAATIAAWADHAAAATIVTLHIEAHHGRRVEQMDAWSDTGVQVSAATVLAEIEKSYGLPLTGDSAFSVGGVVDCLAGRVVLRAVVDA